jgi:radical SAM protein with 4Fe4S-binding SPASM domain
MTDLARRGSARIEIQDFPLWDKMKGKHVPLSFDLEITARCSADCRHCYINLPASDAAATSAELTAHQLLGIARQAVDLGAMWCLVTGGEPLLRDDFEEIYLGLKRMGLLVSVFTNACLVTHHHVELFKQYPPRDVEVTVYGVTRDTYEAVTRRPGSFDAFMRGLDRLQAGGVRLRLKAMALRSNLHEQPAIADFCRARTKDYYRFDPQLHMRFDGNAARNLEIRGERLTPDEIVALERSDQERSRAMQETCDALINPEFGRRGGDHLFQCGAGNGSFTVSFDGRFRLCSSLWAEGTTYDLREGTLADAWVNFVPKVRDLRSRRKQFLDSCRKCEIVNLCLWCPAHAHLETGMLDGATPDFCAAAHGRAEALKAMAGSLAPDQASVTEPGR